MADDKDTFKPVAIGTAAAGWRVVHYLRKPPWVSEEPIAAFYMDNEYMAYPMVREGNYGWIRKLAKDDDYGIAAPGELAEDFVEKAKENAREHRAWLAATRDKRKEEREAQRAAWEFRQKADEYEATGRAFPSEHPARPLLSDTRLSFRPTEEDASRIGLAWFLVEHATFAPDAEVGREAFEKRLGAFLDSYELKRLDSAVVLRLMQRVKRVDSFKFKGKVDGWKGLSLRADGPEEARPLDPDNADARSLAATVFRAHCVAKAAEWQTGGVPQSTMLAAFRAWCVGYRLKPWAARDLYSYLQPWARLPRAADPRTGERNFEGVVVHLPKPGERVLRPGRGKGRRGLGLT